MSGLWTPPKGFFASALSFFRAGNIARFEVLERADSECDFITATTLVQNFLPACDGGMVGRRIHFWKGEPPTDEFWSTIDSCSNGNYVLTSGPGADIFDGAMTISTNLAATLHDFWHGYSGQAPPDAAAAIRYGWLFSDQLLTWWRRSGFAVHWLGPV